MNVPIKTEKGFRLKRIAGGLCTGVVVILCLIWGAVLLVIHLIALIIFLGIRLFERKEQER